MKVLFVLLLIAGSFVACNSSSQEGGEPESTNVLKEYVDAPKQRANNAKNKVEDAQDAVSRQAEMLGNE